MALNYIIDQWKKRYIVPYESVLLLFLQIFRFSNNNFMHSIVSIFIFLDSVLMVK